ncbi:MAG: AraC family transcriptional regulator [Ruminococcaceae bacterium]|nr:AraC family transcriptional regulator [Oscillospiraceae bacterium]
MLLNFDEEKLIATLNDFYNITGLNITIRDENFELIGKNEGEPSRFCAVIQSDKDGLKNCCCSDNIILERCRESKKIEIHTCHAGLVDIAVPLISNEKVIAFIILGQIKNEVDFEEILNKTKGLNCDKALLEEGYLSIREFDFKKINSVANIALMLAEHILINNMLEPLLDTTVKKSIEYINKNICKNITVKSICDEINVSKSAFYKSFKSVLNISPNQYINSQKILKAKELIKISDMSIKEISFYLGFTNTTYFYKLFKKITGVTTNKYKSMIR